MSVRYNEGRRTVTVTAAKLDTSTWEKLKNFSDRAKVAVAEIEAMKKAHLDELNAKLLEADEIRKGVYETLDSLSSAACDGCYADDEKGYVEGIDDKILDFMCAVIPDEDVAEPLSLDNDEYGIYLLEWMRDCLGDGDTFVRLRDYTDWKSSGDDKELRMEVVELPAGATLDRDSDGYRAKGTTY